MDHTPDPPHEPDPDAVAMHDKVALVHAAEADLLAAMSAYRQAITSEPAFPSTPITYTTSTALYDDRRYIIDQVNTHMRFAKDPVYATALDQDFPTLATVMLSQSPAWEDRVRAANLYTSQRDLITLPDDFPCIYEPATSPRQAGVRFPQPHPWVVSPDEAMLCELLPLYQELWGTYEAQWPNSPMRHFEVGRLSGLSPNGVYRPGATPSQVIANTMLTHTGMYATAPEHLRKMHPQYEQWTKKPVTA